MLLSINKPIFGCNEGIGSPILERRHPNFGRGGQPNYVVSNHFKPSAGGRRSIERAGISARALIVTRFIVLWLMGGRATDLRAATHLDLEETVGSSREPVSRIRKHKRAADLLAETLAP